MCKIAHMFDWQDLRFFLTVARLGSLAAAAAELGVDHATAGRRVARFEAATGLKLIDRLPRSSRLTQQGAALASVAAPMADAADAVQRHLRGQTDQPSATVTVSLLPALAAFVVAPSLASFRARFPNISVTLSAATAVASLERGEADLAIGFVRPEFPGRIVRRLGALSLRLFATKTYLARPNQTWAFIGFEPSLAGILQQRWLDQFASGRPFALRSNDVATQHQAARAGLGIALLPAFLGDRDEELAWVAVEAEPPVRALWMSVHSDVRNSSAVRAVMDHLIALFAQDPLAAAGQ